MAGNRFDDGLGTKGAHYHQREYVRGLPGLARALRAGRQTEETLEIKDTNSMKRLESYFSKARSTNKANRQVGIEVETLFVEKEADFPITRKTSQQIFLRLVSDFDWKLEEVKSGTVVRISRRDPKAMTDESKRFELFYDLGWNNLELITPTWLCADYQKNGLRAIQLALNEIKSVASIYGAMPLSMSHDFDIDDNTLIMPDKRDEVWLNLDGPALAVLGHIASVHLNIDLVSIEEGFEFIRRLNHYYTVRRWPTDMVQGVWGRYISESCAGYEPGRYGPPPEGFDEYLAVIGSYKVYMNRTGSDLERVKCARPYKEMADVNLDLFLRSVWWWSRLRVRNGKLVLEIRAIPRRENSDIRLHTLEILAELGILNP